MDGFGYIVKQILQGGCIGVGIVEWGRHREKSVRGGGCP